MGPSCCTVAISPCDNECRLELAVLFSGCVVRSWQVIEVDPDKFAADLESYEDLKRRLVVDTASFGAVGAFVAFEVWSDA